MRSQPLVFLLFALAVSTVESMNSDMEALMVWKMELADPNNVLESWDSTYVNPCIWLHLYCNRQNSVIRLSLGNMGLSGPLVPQLGTLANLQYFDASGNNISGSIPEELGNLKSLVSLDLQENQLTGNIPETLGNLTGLKYLKLNSNKLTGKVPANILGLVSSGTLGVMNVSDNYLTETLRGTSTATTYLINFLAYYLPIIMFLL